MRNTHTFTIKFILRMNKFRNHRAPIYARISVDGVRKELAIKETIDPDEWDNEIGKARGNRPESRSLNIRLVQIKSELMQCYQDLRMQHKLITADKIKNLYLGVEVEQFTLSKLIEYHETTASGTLAPGTLKNYFTTQKYLYEFIRKRYKTSDIYLSEINYQFITEFEYFLRSHQPIDHQRPLQNNGVMKHMERFRKLLHLAKRLEWLERNPFESYQFHFKHVDRGYLTVLELEKLEQKTFTIERMQLVRDLFIFACYTGVAYVDISRLTPDNLRLGIDAQKWLFYKRKKTEQSVAMPVLPKAMEIIWKYKNHPRALHRGTLFPVLTNQRLNSYLKEIADLTGIDKNLTFHLARHTFATTVTLSNNVPIETVSKMLGHTKIATTQIYARVIETKISHDMEKLRENLNQTSTNFMLNKKSSKLG
ncbi:transposase [Prolixibacter bellariivorans]|uniref:Transposase n=1 Tax=Prolixibacter bellariivorans TaxID=314319 RepID=A0A5M4ATN3_9BACT|nr:site-specific integrase [Prolixibacter bellariivorans]GET31289.1 transposase [Prolixibacter bellariivorans]